MTQPRSKIMRNYRNAFFLALVGNLTLAGVLAGIWWTARRPAAPQHLPASASNAMPQPVSSGSPSSAPSLAENPLAPSQLSAERMQSIGVKFGEAVQKTVQDDR